ncbi:IS30 family transposase [Chryseobacterium sp.]|uniref:IS30 family transposase n=1 Tax=Chryseobacterium sp. TaxID=1871047 RepID=UPI002FCC44A9
MNKNKSKHLTLDDRIDIQECLSKGMTFKAIAKRIQKDQTTVSKEVKKHLFTHNSAYSTQSEVCPLLLKAPFVCNSCKKHSYSSCHLTRQLYNAKRAQADYEKLLVESRVGIPLNKDSFYQMESIISRSILKGQHIYHILKTYKLPISKSTVYRHMKKLYYTATLTDLPRLVKFKPRVQKRGAYIPKSLKKERSYDCFTAHLEENDIAGYVEMDTVISNVDGKAILTMIFTASNFMFGTLLEQNNMTEVTRKILDLKEKLMVNGYSFGKIFPVVLTDNGGEFWNIFALENDANGDQESKMFFCDPASPAQKARVEKNHTLFRDIVPKGSSFENLTQEKIDLIFSHINSVCREKYNGKSAYDMFSYTHSERLANILGIQRIAAEEVIQSTKLLK